MRIIVAGDGKVGLAITRLLSQEGHDIVAIDTKSNVLQDNLQDLDVMTVAGNCASMDTLYEAGIEQTDVLIAATNADETNLLCCLTGRKLNSRLYTIARVRNPEYTEQLYKMREDFGLSLIINPEKDAAKEIYRLLQLPGFIGRETFAKGRVEIVELKIEEGSPLEGVQLTRMHYALGGKKVLVCAVIREGEVFIPTSDTVFKAGDHIFVTAPVAILSHILKKLGITQKRIKYAMLIGGGRVCYYLAKHLADSGVHVKIIEKDPNRCIQLASELPRAAIIQADGTTQHVLESEGLAEMDALVTMSAMEEQNVFISMYGHMLGVPNIITRLNRTEMNGMLENLPIGSVVSPKELCSENIVQYIRAMQNQAGAAVSVHRIAEGRVEALEFVINKQSRYVGEPLKNLKLKKNVLLSCITRHGTTTIPDGNSTFEPGDNVVVVTSRDEPILQFNDIFA